MCWIPLCGDRDEARHHDGLRGEDLRELDVGRVGDD